MAGRRLSSNDVSVVIALAIVVLVLLLIFLAERTLGRADESAAVARAPGVRPVAQAVVFDPLPAGPAGAGRDADAGEECGIVAPRGGASEAEGQAIADRQHDEALHEILAALDASSEPRARAAGLYFRASRGLIDASQTETCRQSPDACPAPDPRRHDEGGSVEALARLAASTTDPQVYAWAYRSCAKVARGTAGSCQMVNARQWAQLDSTNAEPWLAVAQEARSRNDGAGVDDAMFHVAVAANHDPGWGRATAQMIAAASSAERMQVGTWLVAQTAIGLETVDLSSYSADASRYCEARLIGNANRRDTCDKIAAVFAERSTTRLGRVMGLALGKRLDWPAVRLAPLQEERDAADAVDRRDGSSWGEPVTCTTVRRDLARQVEVARVGEMEALRRHIAATGESIATLAAEMRRAREADAAVAAAASAAGATTSVAAVGAAR